jgi:hypothetical protein
VIRGGGLWGILAVLALGACGEPEQPKAEPGVMEGFAKKHERDEAAAKAAEVRQSHVREENRTAADEKSGRAGSGQ